MKVKKKGVVVSPKTGVLTIKGGTLKVQISKLVESASGKKGLAAIESIRKADRRESRNIAKSA